MTAALVLLGLAAALAVWSYLVYPPLIRALAAARGRSPAIPPEDATLPSVEVLVAAADEEDVIGERVQDLLAQSGVARYAIAVGCDGCADATAARAREAAAGDPRVRIVEFPARRGKAAVLNDLVASSGADLLVFTDANTRFEPGAVRRLAGALVDSDVGAACGRLVFDAPAGGDAENVFWERETDLKAAEGALGVCLGANGAIHAARRASVAPLPPGTAMDDFLIAARVAKSGERVVFVRDAVAREDLAGGVRAELGRRFRLGVGAGEVLRREGWLWSARRPLLLLAFFSRKAARWLAPVLAGLAILAALASRAWPAALAAIALAAVLLGLARANAVVRGLPGKIYYFVVINASLAAGVAAGLAGFSRATWRPTPRTP